MQATIMNQFTREGAASLWITVGARFWCNLVQELGKLLPASEKNGQNQPVAVAGSV